MKGSKMWSYMTFKVILHFIKKLCLHNVDILENFQKAWALDKKYNIEDNDFEILR